MISGGWVWVEGLFLSEIIFSTHVRKKGTRSFSYKISHKEIIILQCTESDWIFSEANFLHKSEQLKNFGILIQDVSWAVCVTCDVTYSMWGDRAIFPKPAQFYRRKKCLSVSAFDQRKKKTNVSETDIVKATKTVKKKQSGVILKRVFSS